MPRSERPKPLRLYVFDVGHGDSLLLEFPGGHAFGIIDCHRRSRTEEPKVLAHLKARQAAAKRPIAVKFAALTHPDVDHVRGYGQVLSGLRDVGIPVEVFWDCPVTLAWVTALRGHVSGNPAARAYVELIELVQEVRLLTGGYARTDLYREVASKPPREAWVFKSQPQVYVEFLAPNQKLKRSNLAQLLSMEPKERRRLGRLLGSGSNTNLISGAFRVRYGKSTLLLTGDMMNDAWDVLLDEERVHDPRAIVLKVPHHGSIEGNFPSCGPLCDRVKELRPESTLIPVISGGYRPKLPHEKTLQTLRKCAGVFYMTGGGAVETRRAHEPLHDDPRVRRMVANDGFATELVCESRPGDGDIRVDCYPDGRCEVSAEIP